MNPTIGRTVHYQSYGTLGREHLPAPRAAIITAIHAHGVVDLCVLNPTGMFFNQLVKHADTPTPGHWNWPPREPAPEAPSTAGGIFPNSIPAFPGSFTGSGIGDNPRLGPVAPGIVA
jgi:hypothetical protein